jgi:N-acetylglucosaminyldiphosphoundecaprenol N-acetyl-beta-D-mannosaminyltransferase
VSKRRIEIVGVKVDEIDTKALIADIVARARERRKFVYAYVNVHACNLASLDHQFQMFLSSAEVVYCDGEGVRLAARVVGKSLPPRSVLTYFFWDICAACERDGLSVYLLGAKQTTLDKAIAIINSRQPGLRIAGRHHGYFAKHGPESDGIVASINDAHPDLLFVGFGMPVQEEWIAANRHRLQVGAILPCGSMIDYAAGEKSVAPAWMADHGMEWVFRLAQEPRRLWRRYLVGNPWFFYRVIQQRFFRNGSL